MNLIVRGGERDAGLACAKAVYLPAYLGGEYVVHSDIYGDYAKRTTDAWGVRVPLLLWMQEAGVGKLYLYRRDSDVTYTLTREEIVSFGVRGQPDQHGDTLNVPVRRWRSFPGKVKTTFVPDERREKCPVGGPGDVEGFVDDAVLAEAEAALPAPKRPRGRPKKRLEPPPEQMALF